MGERGEATRWDGVGRGIWQVRLAGVWEGRLRALASQLEGRKLREGAGALGRAVCGVEVEVDAFGRRGLGSW